MSSHRLQNIYIYKMLESSGAPRARMSNINSRKNRKPMVRYLAIKETLQEKIKDTLEHNNQSYGEWCAQTDERKNNTSFSWPYMLVSMI